MAKPPPLDVTDDRTPMERAEDAAPDAAPEAPQAATPHQPQAWEGGDSCYRCEPGLACWRDRIHCARGLAGTTSHAITVAVWWYSENAYRAPMRVNTYRQAETTATQMAAGCPTEKGEVHIIEVARTVTRWNPPT